MGEIKFRVWSHETDRMYYPVPGNDFLIGIDGRYYLNIDNKENLGITKLEIQKYTVMQYIGLMDANDIDICVGDIVRLNPYKTNWEVFYNKETGAYWLRNMNNSEKLYGDRNAVDDSPFPIRWEDCEVLGNIYENAYLL